MFPRDRLKTILSEVDPGGAKRRADAGPQRRRRNGKSMSQSPTQEDMQSYAQADILLSAAGLLDAQGEIALQHGFTGQKMPVSDYIDPALSS